MTSKEQEMLGSVTLHLLDSTQGRPVQTWHFIDRERITIGRASDNDVSLTDVHVSRLHAELLYRDGQWWLHSHGRNGTVVEDAVIDSIALYDRAVFQLGSNGPTIQFVTVSLSISSMATLDDIVPQSLDFLRIDEQRKTEDVQQIAEGTAFQQLQKNLRQLKYGDTVDD